MAWVAEDTFEGATDEANLTAWSGGTGWAGAWVNAATNLERSDTATAYDGSVSARVVSNAGNTFYTRTLSSSTTSGVVYVALSKSSTSAGENSFSLRSSAGGRAIVRLTAAGNLQAFGSSGAVNLLAGFTVNTWYVVRITFDTTAGTFTAAYSTGGYGTGGTFGTESSSITMFGSGAIDRVGAGGDTGANSWVDYISGTTPFSGGGGSPTPLLMMMGMGS